jgi:hypothetical protein
MPERFLLQFQLGDGSWMDEAVCLRRRFERLDNGSYICSEFSSGLWLRCIADHADHFEHVDGGGKVHRYRLRPAAIGVRFVPAPTRLATAASSSKATISLCPECGSSVR